MLLFWKRSGMAQNNFTDRVKLRPDEVSLKFSRHLNQSMKALRDLLKEMPESNTGPRAFLGDMSGPTLHPIGPTVGAMMLIAAEVGVWAEKTGNRVVQERLRQLSDEFMGFGENERPFEVITQMRGF